MLLFIWIFENDATKLKRLSECVGNIKFMGIASRFSPLLSSFPSSSLLCDF